MTDTANTDEKDTAVATAESIAALEGLRRILGEANDKMALDLLTEGLKVVESLFADRAKLTARVAELEQAAAKSEQAAQEEAEQRLLPVRTELEDALAEANKQRDEYALALASQETQIQGLTDTLNRLEVQRDEFDAMLRVEEARRQQAETDKGEALAAAARFRLTALKAGDPAKRMKAEGEGGKPGLQQVQLRVMAWLGNSMARAELGLPANVCPLCRGSPACYVDPRRPNPHGKILPADVLMFLRDLVTEAIASNKDPIAALDAWGNGSEVDVAGLPERPAPEAPPAPPPPANPPPPEALGAQVAQG